MAKHFAFIKIKCISFANCHRKYFKTISKFYHNFVSKMEFGFISITVYVRQCNVYETELSSIEVF